MTVVPLVVGIAITLSGAFYAGTAWEKMAWEKRTAMAVQAVQEQMAREAARQGTIARQYLTEKDLRLKEVEETIRVLTNDLKNIDTTACPTLPDNIMQDINTIRRKTTTTGSVTNPLPRSGTVNPRDDLQPDT